MSGVSSQESNPEQYYFFVEPSKGICYKEMKHQKILYIGYGLNLTIFLPLVWMLWEEPYQLLLNGLILAPSVEDRPSGQIPIQLF